MSRVDSVLGNSLLNRLTKNLSRIQPCIPRQGGDEREGADPGPADPH